jgi:decaprenylphospho-beta-D-ribofuranose 2-oxidase
MTVPFAEKEFKSFDGGVCLRGSLFAPDRYRLLERIFQNPGGFAVQGAGLSYVPLSFGQGSATVQMKQFNRLLAFDQTSGIIEIESGLTLGELAEFIIPKGWYLKVQPGHPSITVGGCLAADVHGKNQFQDLNFKEQVLFLRLFHPDQGYIFCDRVTNPEIFHLTCGGYGLSGIVISFGIQLEKLSSIEVETQTLPIDDIFALPKLLLERSMTDDLIYSWHDFNSATRWGAGFLTVARYLSEPKAVQSDFHFDRRRGFGKMRALSSESKRLPMSLMNPMTVRAMNWLYSAKELNSGSKKNKSLTEFLFPVIGKTVYFDLFGRRGFHESQVLIPLDRFEDVMKTLKVGLGRQKVPVTLASCKLFKGEQELLRFIGDGVVLALNFPRTQASSELLAWWDKVVCDYRCLPNLSKDSRLSLEVVERCYPQLENFKTQLEHWDPKRRFKTELSRRLNL